MQAEEIIILRPHRGWNIFISIIGFCVLTTFGVGYGYVFALSTWLSVVKISFGFQMFFGLMFLFLLAFGIGSLSQIYFLLFKQNHGNLVLTPLTITLQLRDQALSYQWKEIQCFGIGRGIRVISMQFHWKANRSPCNLTDMIYQGFTPWSLCRYLNDYKEKALKASSD